MFAERGIDAPLDEIAHRAEIGNATLYRHFPDRCQLIAAVFTDELARYADLVQKALRAEDPGAALREYVQASCALQAGNRGLADLLTSTVLSDPHLDALRRRARRDLGRLIRRAQQAGALRVDFRPQDVVLILMANAGIVRRTADNAPTSSARLVALLLDGLAADAATLAPPPPSERAVLKCMEHA